MKELFEIFASIPFVGIVANVFTGRLGWKPPVAFVLQVALQIVCVTWLLQLSIFGTVILAGSLIALHLLVGLLIGMMPLSGMGPADQQPFKTASGFVGVASVLSIVATGFGGAFLIGVASVLSAAGLATFLKVLALSCLGGTVIHLFGVVLPVYQLLRSSEERANPTAPGK